MQSSWKLAFYEVDIVEIVQSNVNAMKIINANDEALSLLPWTFFYQKVEYIWSSWNDTVWQYINTWITKTSWIPLKVEADLYWFSQTADYWIIYWIYDSRVSWVTNSYHFWFQKSNSSLFNKIDWTEWYATWNPNYYSTNKRYKITSDWTSNRSSNLSMFLLAQNENWSPKRCLNWRLYYCKIWSNWNLVREFIPCYRKSDNVIWLYDKVNDVFYTNKWYWSFTKWPDL